MNYDNLELTIKFQSDTMHIMSNGLEEKFTKQQSLGLLKQDRVILGDDHNLISIGGYNMEKLQKEIKMYYLYGRRN